MQIKNWNWSITGKTIRSNGDVQNVRAADDGRTHSAVELQGRSVGELKVRAIATPMYSISTQPNQSLLDATSDEFRYTRPVPFNAVQLTCLGKIKRLIGFSCGS